MIVLYFIESWAEVITSRMKQMYIAEFTHSGSNNDDVNYIATIQGVIWALPRQWERYHQGTIGQILKMI